MRAFAFATTALLLASAGAHAAETVTYSYDAKGRLIKAQHTGGRNDGLVSTYSLDAADNRTAKQVTGARPGIIIVPLGGLMPIPIG